MSVRRDPSQHGDVLSLSREDQLRVLSERLTTVSTIIDTRQFQQAPRMLHDAQELCELILPKQAAAARSALEDLSHRLKVWRDQWPRLQSDTGFRIAVARELRLWSQQLLGPLKPKSPTS